MSPYLFTDIFQYSILLHTEIAGFLAALPALVTFEMLFVPNIRRVAKFMHEALALPAHKSFKYVIVKPPRATHLTNLIL